MELLSLEPGRVVTSRQGRDRDRSFVILRVEDDKYVYMADGLSRRMDHPKKKKIKHIKARPALMDMRQAWPSGHMLDSDLRSFLNDNGYGMERPLCKED